MCGIKKCCICQTTGEQCGKACHSYACQIYLKIYASDPYKHKQDPRVAEFDPHIYRVSVGSW